MFKKIGTVILALALCLTGAVYAAYNPDAAANEEAAAVIPFEPVVKEYYSTNPVARADIDLTEVTEYIAQQLRNKKTSVAVIGYQIPTAYIANLFTDAIYQNPDLFYVKTGGSYSVNTAGTYVHTLYFDYFYTGTALNQRVAAFEAETDKILSLIEPDMTDFQKALVVHDYFALNYEYNHDVTAYEDAPEAFRADGVMVDKKGVCQSYTYAYKHILNTLGIECEYAASDPMNHIWNIVKIGNNRYHVDITWDDPITTPYGYILHEYFMLSDTALATAADGRNPHYDWVSDYECTSTDLDGSVLKDVVGNIPVIDNAAYYIDNGSIMKYNFSADTSSGVYEVTDKWKVWNSSSSVYTNKFARLAEFNGKLYFNTPTAIKSVNTDGTGLKTVYTYTGGDGYIYGIIRDGNNLNYGIATAPDDAGAVYILPFLSRISASLSTGTGLSLSADLDGADISGELIASVFGNDGVLLDSKIYDAADTVNVSFDKKQGSYILLMWWDISTLRPVSYSLRLDI